jgi:hypothetical protein
LGRRYKNYTIKLTPNRNFIYPRIKKIFQKI